MLLETRYLFVLEADLLLEEPLEGSLVLVDQHIVFAPLVLKRCRRLQLHALDEPVLEIGLMRFELVVSSLILQLFGQLDVLPLETLNFRSHVIIFSLLKVHEFLLQ